MTNRFDFGSMPVRGGFLAFYRMVHASTNFVLRDGKHEILFATAEEAEREAGRAFKEYLNSPISGFTANGEKLSEADAAFPSLKRFTRAKGSGRLTQVERKEDRV